MERFESLKIQVGIIIFAQVVAIVALAFANFSGVEMIPIICLAVINSLVLIWLLRRCQQERKHTDMDISRVLGHDIKDALLVAETGIITYDDQFVVTWTSDFLNNRHIDLVGKKLSNWSVKFNELLQGDIERFTIHDSNYTYEIAKKENGKVIFVKDITRFSSISQRFKEDGIVAGLLQLDNYMEVQQYEDENKMAQINTSLRQPVLDWANRYGMLIRRLRSDRFLVILNEKIFQKVINDKFSILKTIRKNADNLDVSITLSMSFAHGTDDLQLLDSMINDLLELAQSRGGDQVAVKKYGQSVKYYGGNSEAKEKRSKVRVRIMSQAIKEAIEESRRVFISGHRDMDFDCMGSALCMSRVASSLGKECYIISKSGGIEPQLNEAMNSFDEELKLRHNFIDDETASMMINQGDLMIVVDHNTPLQNGARLTLEKAKKIIVIDHHRRSETFMNSPLLVYVETSASSTCELVSEFLPYQNERVIINEIESTIMYAGVLVDTNHFKNRTSSRTFEAVAYLKKIGADASVADNLLKDAFNELKLKNDAMHYAYQYGSNMVIVPVDDTIVTNRTLLSQVADNMLDIKNIEASFVIAKISEHECAISARSKGKVNVQMILEKMNGGGHFSSAGLQRSNTNVKALCLELQHNIDIYLEEKEENTDEGHSVS